ncbi:MAG: methyl-accepting chemotaxis protein [Desulfurispora sp.]|uniref:methyl-accepting chemotaxis protein n=1 Tax=Desulfurispora sp. TaxID=3014275 RepID=UPI00404AE7F3
MLSRYTRQRHVSVRTKLAIPITLVVFLSMTVIVANGMYRLRQIINTLEEKQLLMTAQVIQKDIEQVYASATLALQGIAQNPDIQEAFARRDRSRLYELTAPIFKEARKAGVDQFQFHLAPAIAFLRLHMPDKYGDDLSTIRPTVVACNKSLQTVAALEEGRGGYGFRVVMPMFYQGKHTGSVEYGLRLDEQMLNKWQHVTGGQLFIYRRASSDIAWQDNARNKLLLAGTQNEDRFNIDPKLLESLFHANQQQIVRTAGQQYIALLIPLHDFHNQPLGYIKLVQSRDFITRAFNSTATSTGVIVLLSLIITVSLIFLLQAYFLRPLTQLVNCLDNIARGELGACVTINTNDEFALLSASFNNMSQHIARLMGSITIAAADFQDSSSQLAMSTGNLAANLRQLNAAAQELSGASQQLNADTHTLSQQTSRLAAETEQSHSELHTSINQVQQIADQMNRLSQTVEKLAGHSHSIAGIVNTVTEIAAQTNLLALNAAIEAARAGEAGRGFTVVAAEIQKLAISSADAGKKIKALIQEVMAEIDLLNQGMTTGKAAAAEGVAMVTSSVERIMAVTGGIQEMLRRLQGVFASIDTLSGGNQQLVASLADQNQVLEELHSQAEQMAEKAQKLNEQLNNQAIVNS